MPASGHGRAAASAAASAAALCLLVGARTDARIFADAPSAEAPQATMAGAARAFLAALTPEQRGRASFALEDEERENWHYVPRARRGIPLSALGVTERPLALALLRSALSDGGYRKATTIMSLELILRALEHSAIRDPAKYYFSIFGVPGSTAWGFRVEGHHLSLNFTLVGGRLAFSPAFFGANPAEIKRGPRRGLRVLGREEDLARALLGSLGGPQRETAVFQKTAPQDLITGAERRVRPLPPVGVSAADLTPGQRERLWALLAEVLHNLPPARAAAELALIQKAGGENIRFGWAGGLAVGQPHYYRVTGPTFLFEYDNTQNDANHVHSVWRSFEGDFGRDLLREHYEKDHRPRAR